MASSLTARQIASEATPPKHKSKKRSHTYTNDTPPATSNSPPAKQPRTEAPPTVPALPHEGESYAAAVKEHGSDDHTAPTNGHHDETHDKEDGADGEPSHHENSVPGENDTAAVKDRAGAPKHAHTDGGNHAHGHDGESAAEKAKVVEGFSFADAAKE